MDAAKESISTVPRMAQDDHRRFAPPLVFFTNGLVLKLIRFGLKCSEKGSICSSNKLIREMSHNLNDFHGKVNRYFHDRITLDIHFQSVLLVVEPCR